MNGEKGPLTDQDLAMYRQAQPQMQSYPGVDWAALQEAHRRAAQASLMNSMPNMSDAQLGYPTSSPAGAMMGEPRYGNGYFVNPGNQAVKDKNAQRSADFDFYKHWANLQAK